MTKEKNNSGKDHNNIIEDIRYYGTIPDEILGEMTPEIIEQYYLWDEVINSADRESGYLPYGMPDE